MLNSRNFGSQAFPLVLLYYHSSKSSITQIEIDKADFTHVEHELEIRQKI